MMAISPRIFGQATYPTTPDSPLFAFNQACTASCWPTAQPPYALMGNTVNYDLIYTNSGAFKLEVGGDEMLTWVTDFERNDFYDLKAAISHWDAASSTATAPPTELAGTGTPTDPQTVFDPDVVQKGDELFAIYYSIDYDFFGGGSGFPGNGSISTDEYRVIFETFTATDPPVQNSITEIQNEAIPENVLYAKNPNIDVSIRDTIAMVWEEQNTFESNNHIYARTYDSSSGLSTTPFDLDPLDFGYTYFYNPDIACTTIDDPMVSSGDHPVYITFIGVGTDGVDLLVYHATVNEIRTAATPSSANLYVVDNLNSDASVAMGNHIRDYLYRPRIAAHPLLMGGTPVQHQYNIVVPELSVDYQYGTNINSYTADIPSSSFHTKTVNTKSPASSANIDCHVNYEPCTAVNQDGYEVVWNADQLAYWPGYSPNLSTVNPGCYPYSPAFFEQTILRKALDWSGSSIYSDYSIVPDGNHNGWFTYTPSVAYDPFQITGASSGLTSDHTFFGFQYHIYDQTTLYKLSQHTNQSLKKGKDLIWINEDDEMISTEVKRLSQNHYQIDLDPVLEDISLIDVHGRAVNPEHFGKTQGSLQIDLNGLPSGVYFLTIFNDRQPLTYKLLSIH
ncbi:MAG: T9SS type A sorting domain-containing protein [Salibacteraceae bacterium]